MLRILSSNQPIAWGIVPITGMVLFALGCALGVMDWSGLQSLVAICVSARLLHLLHAESGMRTRPGSIPGWVWVLVATPFIGIVPDAAWWVCPCLFQGLRLMLRIKESTGFPGTFMFVGMWWCTGLMVDAGMWPLVLGFTLNLLWVHRPAAEELFALMVGLLAPFAMVEAVLWMPERQWQDFWGWNPDMREAVPMSMAWFALPTALGWVIRQGSLNRATAQQRFARKATQWAGALGLASVLLVAALGAMDQTKEWMSGWTAAPPALAFMAAWSWPWLMPPGFRWTRYVPIVLAMLSVVLLMLRGWPWA